MKKFMILSIALLTTLSMAHDEGHGPKLTDSPKQGGKVAPIIIASEAPKGLKAQLIYKSELVRSEENLVKVFLYDSEMNPLSEAQLAKFVKTATATVEHIKKGKTAKTSKFTLEYKNGAFEGNLGEKPKTQTFNVDVKMKESDRELLAAFDGLETKIQ